MLHLVEVKRRIKGTSTRVGFVVDFSDELLLFHALEESTFRLNGYIALRDEDISGYRVFDKPKFWLFRAVQHFQLKPVSPTGVSVTSLPDLLRSAARHYPLLTLRPELKKPNVAYIGPLVSMTERTLTIDDLNADCEWTGLRRMKLCDITRVDFGGGYEEALTATAPKRPKEPR